jgi:hypothetical protein
MAASIRVSYPLVVVTQRSGIDAPFASEGRAYLCLRAQLLDKAGRRVLARSLTTLYNQH